MANIMDEYKQKLLTAEQAAQLVKSGDWVQYGEFVQQPLEIDAALAARKDELKDVKIRLVTMTFLPQVCKVDPARESFCMNDWHFSGVSRKLQEADLCNYIPQTYHEGPSFYRRGYDPVDICFQPVTPMNEKGYFNVSTSNSISAAVLEAARIKVLYVNQSAPWCCGGSGEVVHISDVDHIVESQTNHPLLNIPEVVPSETDKKIAEIILGTMRDGDCVQLGIGGMPNAVGAMIAQSDLRDLGVHTEMLVDSFVDMYNAGKLSGKKKQIDKGKMVYTFAMGTQKLYDFMDYNPVCASYPVDYTNDPFVIAQNDNMVSVNSAISVDLMGQVAADAMGARQFSGVGGQVDFVRGAARSRGGRSIIALPATAAEGRASRIVAALERGQPVTTSRNDVDYVVTEFGVAHLKGRTLCERADALLAITAPAFRDQVRQEGRELYGW